MKVRAWIALGTLFTWPAWAQEPAPTEDANVPASTADEQSRDRTPDKNIVVLDAETSRVLRQFIAERDKARLSDANQSDSNPDRESLSPTAISGELKAIPTQRVERPYTIGCDRFDCYSFDRSGKVLEKIPREKVFGKFGSDPDNSLTCQSDNNMLSTFERDANCRGMANGLVNPYRPVDPAELGRP